MAKFIKGKLKTGGRKAKTPNVTTREAREILNKILFTEIDNIQSSLSEIRKGDNYKYLDILSKLLQFSLPKKADLTSDDKPLQPITGIQIILDDSKT